MHEANKYIISGDGEFVRDFEGMYKNIADPWDQRKKADTDVLNILAVELAKMVVRSKGMRRPNVLDIGCGPGHLYPYMLKDLDVEGFVGTDISATAINQAKQNFPSLNFPLLSFIVDDIRFLNKVLTNRFDLIFCGKTLYYVAPEIEGAIDNIDRYLREGGIFVFTYNEPEDAFSKAWLDYKKLRKLLRKHFRELYFVEINRGSRETFVIGAFTKTPKRERKI